MAAPARIPLLDLKAQNAALQGEINAAILRVAHSGHYILGPEVEAFEQEWAAYCGTAHCVGTANALDALRMCLMAWGIGPGAEVIVPSNGYIATWLAVSLAGATPVPAEPDPATFNLDPQRVADAITPRTAAILAVDLYGLPAAWDALRALARGRGLYLLEDAAQAHGARLNGIPAGALGDAAAFSFYPSKNLGALGDAGAVTTNDAELAAKVRRLRNYGGDAPRGRTGHLVRGINSRLDEMQAAILRAKLPHLDRWNREREQRATFYRQRLGDVLGLVLPSVPHGAKHAFHQYVIRVADRDRLIAQLARFGIEGHVHYPTPPYLEPAYAELGYAAGAFPIAEDLAESVLSLPIGYECDVGFVGQMVRQIVSQRRKS